jgi:hypothetical protein
LYRCIDSQCVLSPGGLELDVCEQICDPQPRLYRCVSGQCVESQDGGMCVATVSDGVPDMIYMIYGLSDVWANTTLPAHSEREVCEEVCGPNL